MVAHADALQEQQVLLATEPSLQSQFFKLKQKISGMKIYGNRKPSDGEKADTW